LSNPNTSEKSTDLNRQENITKGNVSAKKVALYTYNSTGDTLEPYTGSTASIDTIQNVELINALRALLQQIAVPSWYDPTTNTLRVGTTAVTVSSGTVTTVTTVGAVTNFGTNAADVMARDISINTWANAARRTIT